MNTYRHIIGKVISVTNTGDTEVYMCFLKNINLFDFC